MGAVVNANGTKHTSKRKIQSRIFRKHFQNRGFNPNHPPSLLTMRPRMLPPGHLPPRMGLPPPPGMRPSHFRGGPPLRPALPPPNMMRGPRIHGPPLPGMRVPLPQPGMRPPPGMNMRPPPPPHMRVPMLPPMMGPHRHFRPLPMHRVQQGKIMKKKRSFAETDLTKPWVNEQIKAEFVKKEELLMVAKNTQHANDWATYRGQRDKCNKIYATAKMEYIGQHPEEDISMSDDNEDCNEEIFDSDHVEVEDYADLHDHIKNINTPEDIAKWIADRKSKFPTKENIEKRYKQQEEMFKRGERLKENRHKNKQNKIRYTLQTSRHKVNKVKKRKSVTPAKTSLIQDKSGWNGNLCPFRGTRQLYEEDDDTEVEEFDDAEWIEQTTVEKKNEKIVLNNALGSLMSAYQSESDEEDLTKHREESEKPLEQKIEKICKEVIPDMPQIFTKQGRKRKHKSKKKLKKKTNDKIVNQCTYKKRKVTLLERLLANEIIHERNILLQCVRYVVTSNFFDISTTQLSDTNCNS